MEGEIEKKEKKKKHSKMDTGELTLRFAEVRCDDGRGCIVWDPEAASRLA